MKIIAIDIVKKLQKAGFEAYFAGGGVRDMCLKKKPQDFDIVTSARPKEIEKLLKKTIPVGKKFGVIIAVVKGHKFEVATFRSDAGYSDGRRPDAVFFTSAKKDAQRRDFTINGMFYDPVKRKLIDYVGGQKDLKKKIIRFIGQPAKRIKEDNLRILRALRFKNSLNFKYEPKTWRAVVKNAQLIKKVSWERIRDELNKMFLDKNRLSSIKDLDKSGVLKYILPELDKMKGVNQPRRWHRGKDVWRHTMDTIKYLPQKPTLSLVWAALLHDIGKPDTFVRKERIRFDGHVSLSWQMTDKILKRLRFSNQEREKIVWLVRYHMMPNDIPKMRPAKKARWLLHPDFLELLDLYKADVLGSGAKSLWLYYRLKKMREKLKKKIPARLPKVISGHDIMKTFKLKPGPKVGQLLEMVKDGQLEGKIKNKKEALTYLKTLKKERE